MFLQPIILQIGADLQPCIAQTSQQRVNQVAPPTSITDFDLIKKLGSGTFAEVYLSRRKLDGSLYAIKCINKQKIIKQNEIKHTNDELQILMMIDNPFIVKLHAAFQNNDYLFLVLDYMRGGELFHHLQVHHRFSERQVTYWAAQILIGLQELHNNGIIMRDLKPENLLLDSNGYIKITDFGLSKRVYGDQALIGTTFCGTSEYLSPELLRNQPHTIAIDLWALGVPPFYNEDSKTMFKLILKSEVKYTERFSTITIDFINKLLQKDPKKRMTSEQAKKHPFFKNIDFDKLYNKEYEMDFIPPRDDNKNFDKEFIQEDISQQIEKFTNEKIDPTIGVKNQQEFNDFKVDSKIEKMEAEMQEELLRKQQQEQQQQQNSNEEYKRYNDIPGGCSRNTICRILVAVISVIVGIGVIVGSIFIAQAVQKNKQNKTYDQITNDYEYQTYLYQFNKQIDVWSHTNISKIQSLPAYEELYTDNKQIQILSQFLIKHNYKHINLYLGCVQYDSTTWVTGRLPAEQKRQQFISKLLSQIPDLTVGGIVYINDDSENMTNYHMIQYLSEALQNYNDRQNNIGKITEITLYSNCSSQSCGIQMLDSLAILKSSLPSEYNVILSGNDQFYDLTLESIDEISFILKQLPQYVNQSNITYFDAVQQITNKITVQLQNNDVMKANMLILQGQNSSQINFRFLINQDKYISGEYGLESFQQLIGQLYEPKDSNLKITIGPENYLLFYQLMYKDFPRDSNTNCLINLYIE